MNECATGWLAIGMLVISVFAFLSGFFAGKINGYMDRFNEEP